MARARNIKPGFFRNADLVELPVETRLLFIGLWTLADREGRLEDRPRQIKMELFPGDSFDIDSMLGQLQAAGFVVRYEVGGVRFVEVSNFIKHQDPHYKEKASEIPPPPGKENFHKATGVTRTQRQRIMERDGFACCTCGSEDALCIDHILPVSRGGDSSDNNLQVLCSACNTRKGNKIGDEEKNTRQRRVDVQSNTNQQKRLLPSDSLIPDSLIPDSPIPEEKKASRKRSPPPPDCPPDVSSQVWEDWLTLRRKKAAPVTATVLESARSESVKAGMSFEAFLTVWCARGSQGLQADWLKPHERPQSHSPPPAETAYQRSMREKVAAICPSIAAKPPNRSETFDVTAKTLGGTDFCEVDADLRPGLSLALGGA